MPQAVVEAVTATDVSLLPWSLERAHVCACVRVYVCNNTTEKQAREYPGVIASNTGEGRWLYFFTFVEV